jgi:cytochrome oxidase Cu insertion factor (SCO1/SenC/PrrC family)
VYTNTAACTEACREALYTLRQSRLMLGKEMDRLERVFLHGDKAPDTLLVTDEHKGLITLQDPALRAVLDNKKPGELATGGFYLIDPHGNLVLYFSPDINPRDMVDDIKRLLKLSRIG